MGKNRVILAIDPGNTESAYCLMGEDTYFPFKIGKKPNAEVQKLIRELEYDRLVIEMIASYGMAVGKEVFDTCVWIGIFIANSKALYEYVYRKDVKINICGTMKAKDNNIRQALIDRFGVVGTKSSPGWFYGFSADIWSAYAVGVTFLDKEKGNK